MSDPLAYLPKRINEGPWFTAYSLDALLKRVDHEKVVLPICSLGTPLADLERLAPLVLPPLYHEAFTDDTKDRILERIHACFPFLEGTSDRETIAVDFEVVELPPSHHAPPPQPDVLAFSVDTAVEEHGPHLPLMTDTIQSYGVLNQLADEFDELTVGMPVEYGHLTWGLPFGLSIDLTPPLVTRYVTGFVNALLDWTGATALYVVDVHGSIVHREAIQSGLSDSRCDRWAFRWLHDPLVEFSGDRGDQHAGGVETALVELIGVELVDRDWWLSRVDELEARQMTMNKAIELSGDLAAFSEHVKTHASNGIVGDVQNYFLVDPETMMNRMLDVARADVTALIENH
jgi:creatinine amidohydrolase/Fe(II)-dependent formamide hydrolase-like protein